MFQPTSTAVFRVQTPLYESSGLTSCTLKACGMPWGLAMPLLLLALASGWGCALFTRAAQVYCSASLPSRTM